MSEDATVGALMKELERYSPFAKVSIKYSTIFIRDQVGDLAALGTIILPQDWLTTGILPGIDEYIENFPPDCPTHEPVDYGAKLAEVEAKLEHLFDEYRQHLGMPFNEEVKDGS